MKGLKTVALFFLTLSITIYTIFISSPSSSSSSSESTVAMASRSFILWLHGLGDSGPANEPIKTVFTSRQLANTRWSFPSAPSQPVSCNRGAVMPSWFDIPEIPVTAKSPVDESSLLKAVKNVHSMIDKEVASGIDPKNVFLCGFSQGGALTLASVLLYSKTLGGGAIFSGWVPFNSTGPILEQITAEAKRTPILWSHGTADGTVLFEAGQAGPPLLQRLGVNCEFKAYPGLGHSINNQELKHVESWITSRLQSSS
ncbi:carboxylesterase SOBER1-like [Bidens hawaiensis]|uniref:carboxylesterase SOBER1-like n=1 Tax=Bidens hawaiensis TaxID=980011 RepID=UPI00404926BA